MGSGLKPMISPTFRTNFETQLGPKPELSEQDLSHDFSNKDGQKFELKQEGELLLSLKVTGSEDSVVMSKKKIPDEPKSAQKSKKSASNSGKSSRSIKKYPKANKTKLRRSEKSVKRSRKSTTTDKKSRKLSKSRPRNARRNKNSRR